MMSDEGRRSGRENSQGGSGGGGGSRGRGGGEGGGGGRGRKRRGGGGGGGGGKGLEEEKEEVAGVGEMAGARTGAEVVGGKSNGYNNLAT